MSEAVAQDKRVHPATRFTGTLTLIVLELALIVCWSAGFIGIRFASDYAPVFLILFWRCIVSGLLLLPFALTIGPRIRLADALAQVVFGAMAMGCYLGAFSLAISIGVPTGLVALITDMLPLIVAILSWPVLGHALNARQWLGSGIGFVGVFIASGWSISLGDVPFWAYGLPILGTAALAMATLWQKRTATGAMLVHQSLSIQCLSGAAVFAALSWRDGLMPVVEWPFIGGILWLVFVATFASWGLFYLALRKFSAARVTAVLYLSPPVTMIWAFIMFGEPLSWAMVLGLIVSLIGIVIFTTS